MDQWRNQNTKKCYAIINYIFSIFMIPDIMVLTIIGNLCLKVFIFTVKTKVHLHIHCRSFPSRRDAFCSRHRLVEMHVRKLLLFSGFSVSPILLTHLSHAEFLRKRGKQVWQFVMVVVRFKPPTGVLSADIAWYGSVLWKNIFLSHIWLKSVIRFSTSHTWFMRNVYLWISHLIGLECWIS